ncbi:metalloregulator ArsR/SmtB family transcription factor [Corynebacterium sp. H128]|uniref:ArsR/SmtB family transcription factor n=1 Tax=unclassified Corynebacterium TaxID=2624378 RepID=UPI0030B5616F
MKTQAPDPVVAQRDYASAELLIRALDSQLRMKILYLLQASPRCVHELVSELESSQPLISQHLKVLRTTGLATAERRGREMYYSLSSINVMPILDSIFELGVHVNYRKL